MTKPFILQMIGEQLESEVNKVASVFKVDRMAVDFMKMYHIFSAHPDVIHSDIFNRICTFHADRDR
jgi:hypothetical protein